MAYGTPEGVLFAPSKPNFILAPTADIWHYMIHMASKLLFHEKDVEEDGGITEVKVWQVPESLKYPNGYKYALYLVREGKVLVGYDNHHPKGHHRHYGEKQEPYAFTNLENLVRDFNQDRKRFIHEG